LTQLQEGGFEYEELHGVGWVIHDDDDRVREFTLVA
jgi:hypothetical protein